MGRAIGPGPARPTVGTQRRRSAHAACTDPVEYPQSTPTTAAGSGSVERRPASCSHTVDSVGSPMTDSAMRSVPVSSARQPTATTTSRSAWQSTPAVSWTRPSRFGRSTRRCRSCSRSTVPEAPGAPHTVFENACQLAGSRSHSRRASRQRWQTWRKVARWLSSLPSAKLATVSSSGSTVAIHFAPRSIRRRAVSPCSAPQR